MWRAPLLSFCSFCHLQSPSSFENSFWGNNTAVHRGGSEELGRVQQGGHQRPHRQRYAGSVPWQSPDRPASLSLLHQASWSQRCLLAPGWRPDLWGAQYLSQPASQRWAKTKRSLTKPPGEHWRIAPHCLPCYYITGSLYLSAHPWERIPQHKINLVGKQRCHLWDQNQAWQLGAPTKQNLNFPPDRGRVLPTRTSGSY